MNVVDVVEKVLEEIKENVIVKEKNQIAVENAEESSKLMNVENVVEKVNQKELVIAKVEKKIV